MAPVARELSGRRGVLEPLQAAASVAGQAQELRDVLKVHGSGPVALVGHSWGAWLGFIFAARHPGMVRKLVLVGSGPFEERYARGITETRLGRLNDKERREAREIADALNGDGEGRAALLARYGALMSKADAYDPLPGDCEDALEFQPDVYASVWKEAAALRRSGELLDLGKKIRCPVLAIHGDFDPHPAEGVEEPLKKVLGDFRLIGLGKCGHEPWRERAARDRFFKILNEEVMS
ncbi:MAG TPA: alpha/beta hydrolase [Methanocella sp.]|nr:alpha/beta hydrolase [Methanocella sp.]